MSRPTEDRAIVDAGLKALAFDSGPPLVCDRARRRTVAKKSLCFAGARQINSLVPSWGARPIRNRQQRFGARTTVEALI
jgi:D-serine deaminase-like pyridoxal phosphate-dependent protein